MNGFDYSICNFISRNMKFYTYFDFCKARHEIKRMFDNMSVDERTFYMWYVYANVHMNETFKNYIWDYLNNYLDDYHLLKARDWYRVK